MDQPVFKNTHFETILVLPTPEGTTVTIKVNQCVKGKSFERFISSNFRQLTEEELSTLDVKSIQYIQKS